MTKAAPKQAAFPLRLAPSMRQTAEELSRREGVSLNQFIHIAVAEKAARMQHEAWLKSRKPYTEELKAEALAILAKASENPVEPGDELPEGYQPFTGRIAAKAD